jgi:hypothetical protein
LAVLRSVGQARIWVKVNIPVLNLQNYRLETQAGFLCFNLDTDFLLGEICLCWVRSSIDWVRFTRILDGDLPDLKSIDFKCYSYKKYLHSNN